MRSDELDYELPTRLIARCAAEPRDAARLMVIERASGTVRHARVRDLPSLGVIGRGDLLVVNRARVLPAYFQAKRAATGGKVGGLYLASEAGERWVVMLEARGKLAVGEKLVLDGRAALVLEARLGAGRWRAKLESDEEGLALLGRIGQVPLPPYIRKARRLAREAEVRDEDAERYNTVYAAERGSLAAPTAGLHFTVRLLDELVRLGVERAELTLHVGLGTFAPIRSETLGEHQMHAEAIHVPGRTIEAIKRTRAGGGRIVAVGTTSVRAMESLPHPLSVHAGDYAGRTELFIHPESGFTFRYTDALLTNFHLPRSTLLALVAALPGVGLGRLKGWYGEAIEQGYRFYSYGDAMLLV